MRIEFNKVTWYSWTLTIIVFLVVVPVLIMYFRAEYQEIAKLESDIDSSSHVSVQSGNIIAKVEYACDAKKTVQAIYYKGTYQPKTNPGEMPHPTGSVKVSLSDGRVFVLPQTISADGGRYANQDESVVFWSKGDSAFVLEHNNETYVDCVAMTK